MILLGLVINQYLDSIYQYLEPIYLVTALKDIANTLWFLRHWNGMDYLSCQPCHRV